MDLTANALIALRARYLLKDESGRVVETPEVMCARVARTAAAAEELHGEDPAPWRERFARLMLDLRFLPNSPMLMNAGKDLGQLAACFVLPVRDTMTSIFDTLKNAALILQSGGGTGFDFSRLRPRDDVVKSTGGIASGPVSFMKVYNTATDVIKQGGARRGANMGMLRVDHPDILDFVRAKREHGELANFNISVSVTDAFMKALKEDGEYGLVNPRTKRTAGRAKARKVFAEIVRCAWETGDPGVVFIDRVNRDNPTPLEGDIESTNPCGEQPLLSYEACILGSLNLGKYARKGEFLWEDFGRDAKLCVRFLDDAIDVNRYPLPEVEKMHRANRKMGLGVMGWADLLVLLGIPYDDPRAHMLARELMRFLRGKAREASSELAEKRGVFPNFPGSVYDAPGMPRLRNATLTTIAPTGTISLIAGCSAGIEPYFALAYKRRILDTELMEVSRLFELTAKEQGFWSKELMREVVARGDLRGVRGVPPAIRRLFRTAHEIKPEDHVETQAAFQESTDNAVSKTINLPKSAKPRDVARAFLLAYEKGCKGVTVFRYGSKRGTMEKGGEVD